MSGRRRFIAMLAAACFTTPVFAQTEVHGSSDVYATPDVALVWGVLRGASDADTLIVIRIVARTNVYGSVAVYGINPFSKAERPLQPATALDHKVDVQIPRSRFAELPRTELRFFATADGPRDGMPKLVVFYAGVPDTTPEFADRRKLEAYLDERIARGPR